MDQVFIDANIFLEVALKDQKSAACKQFLDRIASEGTLAYTTDFILYTCLLQIQYHNSPSMKKFILSVQSLPTLHVLDPTASTLYQTIDIMKTHRLDFDDALVVAAMKQHHIQTLVSLDKDFDRVKTIQRIEP